MPTRFVTRKDGLRLAYRHVVAVRDAPTLVFLPGYMSDMAGQKATMLYDWAGMEGYGCLLLDYAGCGKSEGQFADGTLTSWRDDVVTVIDAVLGDDAPVMVVGSSMGGWLMLLVALARPHQVKALVGIAAAPDFTDWGFDEEQKAVFRAGDDWQETSVYADTPYLTTAGFWHSGEASRLLDSRIAIDCPVRLLHGQADEDVPWGVSVTLGEALRSSDVQLRLIKDGDHRLSRDADLDVLRATVAETLSLLSKDRA